MNRLSIFITLALTFISSPAFSETDLVGTWTLDANCLEIGNNSDPYAPGIINQENLTLVISWQQQGLYKGYICNLETPNGLLFGTIVNNKITLTQWDAIVEGKLQGNNIINLISQHALMNPPSAPSTCIGSITRISNTIDCLPGPPLP